MRAMLRTVLIALSLCMAAPVVVDGQAQAGESAKVTKSKKKAVKKAKRKKVAKKRGNKKAKKRPNKS